MSCDDTTTTTTNGSSGLTIVDNYIADNFVGPQRLAATASSSNHSVDGTDDCCYMDIHNPATSLVIGKVCLSNVHDVEAAVEAASTAFISWSALTIKARAVRQCRMCGFELCML